MGIADRIERRLLGMARALCLITLVGIILAMIALMFALGVPRKAAVISDPPVSASEVLSSIAGSEAANDGSKIGTASSNALANVAGAAGLIIPAPLSAVLNQDSASQPLLEAWLERIPQADRQQFMDELSDVVAVAGQHAAAWEWDDRERYVATAMNQYALVKIGRVETAESAIQAVQSSNAQLGSSLGVLLALTGFLI